MHMVSEGDRDSGGLELVIVRVRTSVWANKERCTTSMAWAGYYVHKYGACYYENQIKQSRNRWHLNRWHFGLIVAPWACDALTQTPFLDDENRKFNRDLRRLTFQVSVIK
jgi:hypothetical protein